MKFIQLLPLLLIGFGSCTTYQKTASTDNGRIDINFVQVNDVYEIAPLSGGREGGIARLATLKKQYVKENPNSFLVIAGDFLSPSVYNSLQYQGKAIRGRQMIEALNVAGTDLACFGNHEFDIREQELQDRIDESAFQWISTNSFHKVKDKILPFSRSNGVPIPATYIMEVTDADGTKARIGFIGICLPFNRAEYVSYTDPLQSARDAYNQLKDSVDAVVAITHQNIADDELLAKELPGLAMILGGHEHDQRFKKVGDSYITKAMANAKSAYIVKLNINKKRNKIKVQPKLEVIDEKIAPDSATNTVVQKWTSIAASNYATLGFNAQRIVLSEGEPLDGRELVIRSQPTNLGKLITSAMMFASPHADLAIMNSGSIRVDDILQLPISEYDIIRTLPFGGSIREVDIKGRLLLQVLDQGKKNVGSGGFLLHNPSVQLDQSGKWLLNNTEIDPLKTYRVAFSEFLLSGREANLEFLNPSNPDITKWYEAINTIGHPQSDIRLAVIRYLDSL